MSFKYIEEVKTAFLQNIGRVIHRNRIKKGYSQENLGRELNVTHSTIERYENAKSDIPASMLANISVILDFPMKEYVEDAGQSKLMRDTVDPIDMVFKKVVEYARVNKMPEREDRPPRPKLEFDYVTGEWQMVEQIYKEAPDAAGKLEYMKEYMPPDTEEQFIMHMQEPEMYEKRELLYLIYGIIISSEQEDIKMPGLKSLAQASLNFITNDPSKDYREIMQDYRQYLALLSETGDEE